MAGTVVVAGLDLAAKVERCSGFAVIDVASRALLRVTCLHSDEDIVDAVISEGVDTVAVDAPLMESPAMRNVDREAIRRGFRVFPPSMLTMRLLTVRAWKLYRALKERGIEVIETHPRSALKASGAADVESLLKAVGVSFTDVPSHKDLRDAVICAVVAYCYRAGNCIDRISADDGTIYIVKRLSQQ